MILFTMIFALLANAGDWIQITPDHENLHYIEGSRAVFRLQAVIKPTNPDYITETTLEEVGTLPPVVVSFQNGFSHYETQPLALGERNFRWITKLKQISTNWEKVVEDQSLTLTAFPE